MPKGKRYILVEVDVDLVEAEPFRTAQPNNLTDDSEHSFDSLVTEIERLGYADGTKVYGATKLHVNHLSEIVLDSLHLQACAREIGALGKECDRAEAH